MFLLFDFENKYKCVKSKQAHSTMRISVLLMEKIFPSLRFHASFSSFELGCKSNQTLRIYQMFGAFLIKIASLVHLIM